MYLRRKRVRQSPCDPVKHKKVRLTKTWSHSKKKRFLRVMVSKINHTSKIKMTRVRFTMEETG